MMIQGSGLVFSRLDYCILGVIQGELSGKVSVLTVWLLGLRTEIKVDIIIFKAPYTTLLCDDKDLYGRHQLSTFIFYRL